MESAYLKDAVGLALSKAMAETVAAQPSNPQEYLALHLLHTLQKQEYQKNEIAQKRRCAAFHQQWLEKQRMKEEMAKKVLQRACNHFRDTLIKRKAEEQELQELFDQSRADADAVLDEVSIEPEEENVSEKVDDDEIDKTQNKVREKRRLCNKARIKFCRAQCLMEAIQKHHLSELKERLVNASEPISIAQSHTQEIIDETMMISAAESERKAIVDRERIATAKNAIANSTNMSTTTTSTTMMMLKQEWRNTCTGIASENVFNNSDHQSKNSCCKGDINYIIFQVLRCLCYLLLDATPKTTRTAEKVALLIKPAVMIKLLRAFNPVATYDKNKCISVYDLLPSDMLPGKGEKDNSDDMDNENDNSYNNKGHRRDGNNNNAHNKHTNKGQNQHLSRNNATIREETENEGNEDDFAESLPISQPKTRQVRRVQRILRILLNCSTYYPNVKLTQMLEHYSNTENEDDNNDEDDDDNSDNDDYDNVDIDNANSRNVNDHVNRNDDLYEIEDKELAREVANIKFLLTCRVHAQKSVYALVKNKGGLILWALLRFIYTAVEYRIARDDWLDACREANIELPITEELPEDEEADPFNEDVLYKEDADVEGEIDEAAVARLLSKIGTDSDESLAKLWENKDEQVRKSLHQKLSAYFHQNNQTNDSEDDEDTDNEENDNDEDDSKIN